MGEARGKEREKNILWIIDKEVFKFASGAVSADGQETCVSIGRECFLVCHVRELYRNMCPPGLGAFSRWQCPPMWLFCERERSGTTAGSGQSS